MEKNWQIGRARHRAVVMPNVDSFCHNLVCNAKYLMISHKFFDHTIERWRLQVDLWSRKSLTLERSHVLDAIDGRDPPMAMVADSEHLVVPTSTSIQIIRLDDFRVVRLLLRNSVGF